MKANYRKLFVIPELMLIIAIFMGCAANRLNLVKKGMVSLELEHTEDVYFSNVNVYQDDEGISVAGIVKSRRYFSKNRMGHVDVIIIEPSGKILKNIGVLHYPRKRPRKGRGSSNFEVHIPLIPPQGSLIQTIYHNSLDIPPEESLKKEESDSKKFKNRPGKRFHSMIASKM